MIASALLGASACRYRPTQITLLVDGDPPASRAATVTIATLEGAASYEQLRGALATPSVTLTSSAQQSLFGNTFSIVPKAGAARTGTVSLLAVYDAPATQSEPALHIERMHRMAFVERVPQQGYLRFASACAARATDCAATVAPEECTVSRRCIEQGATCGDNGECVRWELPLTAIPVGTMLDGSSAFDASVSRLDAGDAAPLDASDDESATDVVGDGAADARDAAAPVLTRLLAPLSTSVLTSRRPTLRWIPAPDAVSMDLDVCRDRMMTASCQTVAVASAERFQPATELEPGTWYWRVRTTTSGAAQTSAVWQFRLGTRSAITVDTTCSSDFDFNGDGFTDVVAGAPGPASNGNVYFYRSSAMGHASAAAIAASATFKPIGGAVANAGDFNGDGLADAVLGAAGSDPGGRMNAGAIRVHFGGGIATSTRLFEGDSAGDSLGRVVDGVGDVDGDGYADIVASVPSADSMVAPDVGAFAVYYGGRSGAPARAPTVVYASAPMTNFAVSVAGAGDVNGDGYADVIVGANLAPNGAMTTAGFAQIYLGSSAGLTTTPAVTWSGQATNERFGVTVSAAGDVNGDGYCDVLVGSAAATVGGVTDVGLVRVFHGAPTLPTTATTTINGTFGKANFAGSLSAAGDVNGDGFADILVGAQRAAPAGRTDAGSVAVFHGGLLGISPAVVTRLDGLAPGDLFGRSVNSCGDVNGDGVGDVIVGAPMAPAANGAAYVFTGSGSGLATTASRSIVGMNLGDQLGVSVAARTRPLSLRGVCAALRSR